MLKKVAVTIGALVLVTAAVGTVWGPIPSLTEAQAKALVRHTIASQFDPRYSRAAISGNYSARYQGRGKWNVSTPIGQWVLLEQAGVAFPVSTNVTMTRALARYDISSMSQDISSIESDVSQMRNDISSMESAIFHMRDDISSMSYDISSMESDISSMQSDISQMNSWGIILRR